MDRVPFIETERLFLYKVDELHCNETYLSWIHDKEVSKYLETGRFPESIASLTEFVHLSSRQSVLFLAIHIKENNKHIGNIKIDAINRFHQYAEYGILMGDRTSWGKGYAKEASIAIIDHCFHKLNLRKINLGVIADNVGAVNLYIKLGFEIEGVYKKHLFCDGSYVDVNRMAVFQEQWKLKTK